MLLRFEALPNCFLPEECESEEFCIAYYIRKGFSDAHSFVPQKDYNKLIVNLANSDHGWRDYVVRIEGPWEALVEKDRGGCQHPRTLD